MLQSGRLRSVVARSGRPPRLLLGQYFAEKIDPRSVSMCHDGFTIEFDLLWCIGSIYPISYQEYIDTSRAVIIRLVCSGGQVNANYPELYYPCVPIVGPRTDG
jgi:hypothetical protein